jgi:hypothetical protein
MLLKGCRSYTWPHALLPVDEAIARIQQILSE